MRCEPQPAAMRSALSRSSRPRSAFTCAAAPLIRPSQRATGVGIGSPETGKFATAFAVSPPQSTARLGLAHDLECRWGHALRSREQLVPRAELHARAAELLAGGSLELVDRRPARIEHEPNAAVEQERVDLLRASPLARCRAQILEQELDGLRCVLLVRADHAARAALDPARHVDARRDAATSFGIVPLRSSNGTPGSSTPR